MEQSAFNSPLSEFGLQELGRLALNFGHVEMLLDQIIAMELKLAPEALPGLVSPLATRRKLEIIDEFVDKLAPKIGAKVKEASKLVDEANGVRNDVLHGHWAFHTDHGGAAAAGSLKKPKKYRLGDEIGPTADKLAIASKLLHQAAFTLMGQDPTTIQYPVNLWIGETEPGKHIKS